MSEPESDVIAAINDLEQDSIDDVVEWQMTSSPAALTEHADFRVVGLPLLEGLTDLFGIGAALSGLL